MILFILKGKMPFKMHKITKKIQKKIIITKNVCVPIFRPVTRNTLIFLFGLMIVFKISTCNIYFNESVI